MKNQKCPNLDRLKKLAEWLDKIKIGLRIDILEDTTNSFKSAKAINLVPVFITPIQNLPRLFKNEWHISKDGEYTFKDDENKSTISSLQRFFGIDSEMLLHLFAPYAQSGKFGGKLLKTTATPKDLAFNINELVKISGSALKLHPDINIFISKN